MPNVELTISVPALMAERLAADASRSNLPVTRHVVQVLFGQMLRQDANNHAAWAAEHPEAAAREERQMAIDEIEREVAQLVEDGMDPADGHTLAAQLLDQYDLTQTPGYLDPGNRTLSMTPERHQAILRATLRADHHQHIAEVERHAAEADARGDDRTRCHYQGSRATATVAAAALIHNNHGYGVRDPLGTGRPAGTGPTRGGHGLSVYRPCPAQ